MFAITWKQRSEEMNCQLLDVVFKPTGNVGFRRKATDDNPMTKLLRITGESPIEIPTGQLTASEFDEWQQRMMAIGCKLVWIGVK